MNLGFIRDLGLGFELVLIDTVHSLHCSCLAGCLGASAWGSRLRLSELGLRGYPSPLGFKIWSWLRNSKPPFAG